MSQLVNERIAATSEANMWDLLRCKEVSGLKFLSEGLARLLDEGDYIFLDTSVLLHGVVCFTTPRDWMNDYRNKRHDFNVISLSKVHYAHERGTDGRINLEYLYEAVQQDLHIGDLNLQIWEDAFKCRPVMLPRQTFEETTRNYTIAKKQIAFEEGRRQPRKRFRGGIRTNRKSRRDIDTCVRSEKGLVSRRFGRVDIGLIECIRANMSRLSGILSFAQLNDRITEDSGIYSAYDPHYVDHVIIDSAAAYPGRVGIATFDTGFRGKVVEVKEERSSRGLPIPVINLLTGIRNLRTYELSRFYNQS